jgi:mannose-6-phosphate isomerase-like protein (cupin superfamily)
MTHEDQRRTLTSIPYGEGELKIIVAKNDCELGNHYHKRKTEIFQLVAGIAICTIEGEDYDMIIGDNYFVDIENKHSFNLMKGSILFCICSLPYDKTDDYEY